MDLSEVTLVFFFTKKTGFKAWEDAGHLGREVAIYEKLAARLKSVNFITYGGDYDRRYIGSFDGISVFPTVWREPDWKVVLSLMMKCRKLLKRNVVLKTNQIPGSDVPLLIKRYLGKKLIVRCGYLYSRNSQYEVTDEEMLKGIFRLEKQAFAAADIGVVTSRWQRDYVVERHNIEPGKIKVVPNYVLPEIFKPLPQIPKRYDMVFTGRGGKEKNISGLLKALHFLKTEKGKNVSLLLVGDVSRHEDVKNMSRDYGLNVECREAVPCLELPEHLNQARIFILPSYYEGHPKSLLEAMCCALPCIGADVDGIRQDIRHMETGFLCKTDFKSIAEAIETVLADEELQKTMGKNAREYVADNYSLDKIFQLELDVFQEVFKK